jgi:hypothetical protein
VRACGSDGERFRGIDLILGTGHGARLDWHQRPGRGSVQTAFMSRDQYFLIEHSPEIHMHV